MSTCHLHDIKTIKTTQILMDLSRLVLPYVFEQFPYSGPFSDSTVIFAVDYEFFYVLELNI